MVGRVAHASVKLDRNVRFSAQLPDFARDADIRSFRHLGEFAFRIRDQKTGNPLFELRAAGSEHPVGYVRAASRYPGTQILEAIAK